jgi:hypothetical protein
VDATGFPDLAGPAALSRDRHREIVVTFRRTPVRKVFAIYPCCAVGAVSAAFTGIDFAVRFSFA